ncbi:MAG: cell division protein FtsA [Caldithrix sp.]|nr:cell division protein FtsA [Caldithrix sp.]
MHTDDIIVGLDIGTTKIAAVIGKLDEKGQINVVGVGHHPSQGLRRGVVIDIRKTVQSIQKAVAQAELLSGYKVEEVYAGIAGDHIRSINSKGVVAVNGKDNIITEDDVERVINAAKAIALPMDREILHVLPQEYIVDDQDGIKDPIGIAGTRLEAEVHIVTAAAASAQNIVNCIVEAGYDVADIVLEPYASSLAVLSDDERDLGVAIMDIGGGTTDIAMFYGGSIHFTSVIGLGGQHVTGDLSQGLRTTMYQAEEIKKKYGIAMESMLEEEELIKVDGIGGRAPREISRSVLAAIIEPRMEEMFSVALREMERSSVFDMMGAGVVLSGGASMLKGIEDLAENILGMPVQVGIPKVDGGLVETVRTPIYSTAVGLIYYGLRYADEIDTPDTPGLQWVIKRLRKIVSNVWNKAGEMI